MAVLYELEFIFAYFQTQLMLGNATYEIKEAMENIVKCINESIIYLNKRVNMTSVNYLSRIIQKMI